MLNIIVCDDNYAERTNFIKIIENVIVIQNFDMKVRLQTSDPNEVLEYAKNSFTTGLYFLDVDLKCDISGIELAEKIRKYDPRGFIVIVTAHTDMLPFVFKHKIEAIDFIEKSDFFGIRSRVEACVRYAHEKHAARALIVHQVLSIKVDDKIMTFEFDEIVSIETVKMNNRKLVLNTIDKRFMFSARLKEMEKRLDERFIRLSQSYIVNNTYIKRFDFVNRKIIMCNGSRFLVPQNRIQEIKDLMQIVNDQE